MASCVYTLGSLATPCTSLSSPLQAAGVFSAGPPRRLRISCSATQEKETAQKTAEEVTRKFGLEAGLWKIFTSKEEIGEDGKKQKGIQAKELLARYGGAYLATSISLSVVSFGLCYVLISSGVDVAGLLQKIGIQSNETGEKVGTFALAYAAHKAASPIRFPPTVALTPIVASWLGKKVTEDKEDVEKS
ncbi:hypothetical protein L7F22_020602 [Adiantum nelumboides]|nr:hypothetical protein [Adiantum nelumboides]